MRKHSVFERIAAVRPPEAAHTRELVEPAARALLLDSITATCMQKRQTVIRKGIRRPVAVITVFSATAVVAALAVTGAVVFQDRPGTTPTLATQTVHDAAYVTARTEGAMDGDAHDVVYVTSIPGNGVTWKSWTLVDGSKGHFTSMKLNGQPINDMTLISGKDTDSATVVSYPDRAWWTWSDKRDPNPCKGVSGCHPVAQSPGLMTPDEIRKQLASGTLKLVSSQGSIDGQPVVELAGTSLLQRPFTLWVNALSYLPIRTRVDNPGGIASQADYTWLPPTADNLAKLEVTIPAGFTHAPGPIVSPVPASGGRG
ncbi:MAG: hypothetical protein ACREP9_01035 [Candidatus Dormibacteraceae bacterium]